MSLLLLGLLFLYLKFLIYVVFTFTWFALHVCLAWIIAFDS